MLFLDQNITAQVVNNSRYKREKGRKKENVLDEIQQDLLVISLLTAAMCIGRYPWLVAATVQSISHVCASALNIWIVHCTTVPLDDVVSLRNLMYDWQSPPKAYNHSSSLYYLYIFLK